MVCAFVVGHWSCVVGPRSCFTKDFMRIFNIILIVVAVLLLLVIVAMVGLEHAEDSSRAKEASDNILKILEKQNDRLGR